jgi:hypothetical protein
MSVKHVKNGIRPSMSTDYEKEINKIDSEIRKLLDSKKKLKVCASKKRKKEQAVKYRAKKKQQLINKQQDDAFEVGKTKIKTLLYNDTYYVEYKNIYKGHPLFKGVCYDSVTTEYCWYDPHTKEVFVNKKVVKSVNILPLPPLVFSPGDVVCVMSRTAIEPGEPSGSGMGYHPDEYHTQYAVNVDNIHVMNMWDNPRCTYRVGGWYKSRDYNFCEKKHKLVHKGDELSLYNLEDINM